MSRTLTATAILDARDKTAAAFASAARRLKAYEAQAKSTQAVLGGLQRVAGLALGAVGTGLGTAAIGRSVTGAAQLDRGLARIAITGEATAEQMKTVEKAMRSLAAETATSLSQVQEGFGALVSRGMSFQEAFDQLPAVVRTAQASGAAMDDVANATFAMSQNFAIAAENMQTAQDMLAKGGKLGSFEGPDMARYLPKLLPQAQALGYAGLEGLRKVITHLQIIRKQTGTSENAAVGYEDLLSRLMSDETQAKFKKFGIDLRGNLEKARKEGKEMLDVFLQLIDKATKGDYSKLPQLLGEKDSRNAALALLKQREEMARFFSELDPLKVKGTVAEDLKRVTSDSQAALDRMAEAADRASTAFGRLAGQIAVIVSPAVIEGLGKVSEMLDAKLNQNDPKKIAPVLEAHLRDKTAAKIDRETKALAALERDRATVAANPHLPEDLRRRRLAQMDAEIAQRRAAGSKAAEPMLPPPNLYTDPFATLPAEARARRRPADYEDRQWEAGSRVGPQLPPLPPVRPGGMILPQGFGDEVKREIDRAQQAAEAGKSGITAALEGIDLAGAGQQAGASFRQSLAAELEQAAREAQTAAARIKQALSFTASPSISPNTSSLNPGSITPTAP